MATTFPHQRLLLIAALLILFSCNLYAQNNEPAPGKQIATEFYSNVHAGKIKFQLYLPLKYDEVGPTNSLLIFLHGIDEVGNEIEKVLRFGPPKLAAEGKQFPMVVISPQQPHFVGGEYQPRFNTALIHELIQYAINTYNIDTTRIYMTGLSMGGNGCWRFAVDHPNVLAAMVPICGQTVESETKRDLKNDACKIKNIPIKVFHGAKDNKIDVHHSIDMVEAIKSCEPQSKVVPQLIIYENAGHDSWSQTYANVSGANNIYSWMLSFRNSNYSPGFSKYSGKTLLKQLTLEPKKVSKLPLALNESSGIIAMEKNKFWSHNDGGNSPMLFCIDSAGKILETKKVTHATNVDWEDITRDNNYFYIGDFGNNGNNRRRLQIYRIPDPATIKDIQIKAETIDFNYPDQIFPTLSSNRNYDVESFIHFNDSLYLFTKNRTQPFNGYVYVYKLPSTPGQYEAIKTDSLFLGKGTVLDQGITSAAISPDKKNLVLLGYNKLWIFNCFKGSDFFAGNKTLINFESLTQKEGVAFLNNTEIYITEERLFPLSEGNLYTLNLSQYLHCKE